jgi:hypothetical protein
MTKALVLAAALGLTVSGASACEFGKTAKSLDKTTVASIVSTTDVPAPTMSTPDAAAPAEQLKDAVPADQDG